jgi:hypothetical protein
MMPVFDIQDMQPEPAPAVQASAATVMVRRTGLRPLAFQGSELCMAMSFTPEASYWYEINIYRTAGQKFVVAVRLFFQSEDERDRVRAWEFETFEQVLDCLESYDAGADVRVDVFADDAGWCAAELAAQAFSLRARVAAARSQYSGLVGEILHELEQAA